MCSDIWLVLQARWRGVLHHVTNVHQWALGDGGGPAACEHGPLPDEPDKQWLEAGSPPHDRLRKVLLDKRLLKNSTYYLHFR